LKVRFKLLFLIFALTCAKKVPPPGKGEFNPPRVIITSPSPEDTIKDSFRLNLLATDSSGLSKVEVKRGNDIIALIPLRGVSVSLDTLLNLPKQGEDLLPDTLTINVFDRWDNISTLKIEVFTFRRKPEGGKKYDKGTGNEGGEDSGGETPPKGP